MSADNGIYILVTKGRKRGQKEYRVIHAQAIENICETPDYPASPQESVLDRECVLELFGECRVFTDRKFAEGYAMCMEDQTWFTEYGISFLDFSQVRFPKPLSTGRSRNRRRSHRHNRDEPTARDRRELTAVN